MKESDKRALVGLEEICNLIKKGELVNIDLGISRGHFPLVNDRFDVPIMAPDPLWHINITGEHLPTRVKNQEKLYEILKENESDQ